MPLQEHEIKLLQDLGLTISQSRVYLALANLRNAATANQVSTFSNVVRQDVYRTLTELQELSLIEKIIDKPTKFKAIQPQEAIAILAERRNLKTRVLQQKATETFDALDQANVEVATHQDKHELALIPRKELLMCRIKKAVKSAKESICVITPWHELVQFQFMMHEQLKQALNSSVKILWLTQNPPSESVFSESSVSLVKHPNFTLRTKSNNPDVRVSIYDNKEAFVAICSAPNAAESPALYTSNRICLHILKEYFELSWGLAKDYKPELK